MVAHLDKFPIRLDVPRRLARDEAAQRRLWELSEAATGLRYPLPGVT